MQKSELNAFNFFKDKKNIDLLKSNKKYSFRELGKALEKSIQLNLNNKKKACVLFSGGVDSSLLAFLLSKKTSVVPLVCGEKNSPVIKRAEKNALRLNLKPVIIKVNPLELQEIVSLTAKITGFKSKLQLQIAVPEFFALRKARELGFKQVFSGQGPDELFAGYKEFCFVLKKNGFKGVERECWNKLYGMFERNCIREKRIADYFGLKVLTPYFFPEFMEQAMLCPARKKIFSFDDELRKREFRRLALFFRLPKSIALQKKKALQYDAGTAKKISSILVKLSL